MRFLFFFLCITNLLIAQDQTFDIFAKKLNPDSAKRDLEILRSLFDKFHPGEFQHITPKDFDQEFQTAYSQIGKDISFLELYRIIQKLSVGIKDGHTYAENSLLINCIRNRPVIPFNIVKVENKFYIRKVATDSLKNFIGKEIVAINSTPISQIVKSVELFMEREGQNESGFNRKYQIFPYYYFIVDTSSHFQIEYIDDKKQILSIKISGVTYKEFLKRTRVIVDPVSFDIDSNGIGVLHVNTFAIPDFESRKINYEKYFDEVFGRCRNEKITHLIIDVRGNGGGNAETSNYLFSYLKKEGSYFYFKEICKKYAVASELAKYCTTPGNLQNTDTSRLTKNRDLYCETNKSRNVFWWLKEQKPKKKPFQGTVVVLEDGGCFSTTGHFIALIRNYNAGYLIGDYSQGSSYSNDGGQYFQLPYSKLKVRIPTAQFRVDVRNFVYDPKGIKPDHIVLSALSDILSGQDPQMITAKRYLLRK